MRRVDLKNEIIFSARKHNHKEVIPFCAIVISKSSFNTFLIALYADICIAITSIICSFFLWKPIYYGFMLDYKMW